VDYGIDVSRWNDVQNWRSVRANGISFASVKISQGDYLTSPTASAQVSSARDAGIAVGGYHFADSNVTVAANVKRFVDEGRKRSVFDKGSFLPMLDMENSANANITWSTTTANRFIKDFIRQLRDATGVAPVAVYASASVWKGILRPDEWVDDQVFLWVALYNGDPGNLGGYSHRRAALHQHTQTGNVPGVAGHVDRNVTLGSFAVGSLTIGNVTPPAPGPAPQPQPTPGGWVDYRVRSGDTLSGIAAARGTTVDELARVNSISNPNLLYVGQIIRVPAGSGGGGAPTTGHYRVEPGDTLSEIAARFGTTVAAIVKANNLANANVIYAGQWLDIPRGGSTPTPAPSRTYTVKSGDTLSGIAQKLGTTVGNLTALNGITNPNRIYPGQTLRY